MITEITNNTDGNPRAWLLYDGECVMCTGLADRWENILDRHGFDLAPLQAEWVRKIVGAPRIDEMKVLTCDGDLYGGADAVIYITRKIQVIHSTGP